MAFLFLTVAIFFSVGTLIPECMATGAGAAAGASLNAGTKRIYLSEGIRQDTSLVHCDSNDLKTSFPNLDYVFNGYDIVEGYPLTPGHDPGFRNPIFKPDYQNGKPSGDCRYMLPKGISAVPDVSCDVSFKSDVIQTTAEFHKSLSASASIHGGGWGFEFSASSSYRKSSSEVSSKDSVFVISKALCTSYFSRLVAASPPPFDEGFIGKVRNLAKSSATTDDVNKFIETYGTHYLDEVTFGSSFTYQHKMTADSYKSLKSSKFSVSVQASYSGLFSVGGGFSLDSEQQQAASSFSKKVETTTVTLGSAPPSNGDALTWAAASRENPIPVSYRLRPITELFTAKYFTGSISTIDYASVKTKLADAPRKSCNLIKARGIAVPCLNPRNFQETEVVSISGGYPRLPGGATEFIYSFYLNTQADCELMCSVNSECVGYTNARSKFCSVVNGGKEYEWKDSNSDTFTLYFNKLRGDLVLKNKVPKAIDSSSSPAKYNYAYYQNLAASDTVPNNLRDCRNLCVRDPKCLAFRFGRCDGGGLCNNRACYIFHQLTSLKATTLTNTEFHFIAK